MARLAACDREERVMDGGARSTNRDIFACRMHAIGGGDDDALCLGIDPDARPREAEMPERPRAGAVASARAALALSVEARPEGATGATLDEPRKLLGGTAAQRAF